MDSRVLLLLDSGVFSLSRNIKFFGKILCKIFLRINFISNLKCNYIKSALLTILTTIHAVMYFDVYIFKFTVTVQKPEDQWSCKRSPEISCIYQ